LNYKNYVKWKYQFISTLTGNDYFGYFDGSITAPTRYKPRTPLSAASIVSGEVSSSVTTDLETDEYKIWKVTDHALKSLLVATLDEDVVDLLVGSETARDAWNVLIQRFTAVSRVSIMHLKTEMQTLSKGSDSIEKYLHKVKITRDKLIAAGVRIPDEDLVLLILNGLPEEYNTVRTVIEGRVDSISIQDLRDQLLATETRIEQSQNSLSTMAAMLAQTKLQVNENQNQIQHAAAFYSNEKRNYSRGSSQQYCSECQRPGHTVEKCFRLHKCTFCDRFGHESKRCFANPESPDYQGSSLSKNFGNKSNSSSSSSISSKGSYSPLSSPREFSPECQICSRRGHTAVNCPNLKSEPSTSPTACQICGLKGHSALNCNQRSNYAYQSEDPPASLTALTAQAKFQNRSTQNSSQSLAEISDYDVWIGDSGATHHMTPDFTKLINAQPYNLDGTITIGDGNGLIVSHVGTCSITPASYTFKLTEVLHVPNLTVNLLSFTKLCIDNNCYIHLDDNVICLQDKLTHEVLYKGSSSADGLFYFKVPKVQSTSSSQVFSAFTTQLTPFEIWHHRLGHPSTPILHQMLKSASIDSPIPADIPTCISCLEAKMHKLPFPVSTSHSSIPFEKIHSDVWVLLHVVLLRVLSILLHSLMIVPDLFGSFH
jgi:histone deacetylase 1/2